MNGTRCDDRLEPLQANLWNMVFITNVKEAVSHEHEWLRGRRGWKKSWTRIDRSRGRSQEKVCTYLHATSISPSHPLVEPGPPIFDEILLGVFDPVTVPESALGSGGGQYSHGVQVHLEVLFTLLRDHIFWAPGASTLVLS